MASGKNRVLHLTHDMAIGGTQQVIKQLVGNLDPSLFECTVACIDGEVGLIGEQLQNEGVTLHVLQRKPGFDRLLINNIRSIINEFAIDLVHCHQYTPYVYGAMAAFFTDAKIIFTEHGRFYPDSYSWKRRAINPILQRRTSSIVAISASTADALVELEWFSSAAIDVIYNGTEVQKPTESPATNRADLGISPDTIVFGTIARFDQIKNLPMMIDAFATTKERFTDTTLLMVGDGDQRESLETMVRDAGLENDVIFTGFQTDTAGLMSILDVYLLTSFSEGTSMTLLESMANSKPSIVTAVGGNVEVIKHSVNGLVVPSGDSNTLSVYMNRLAGDEIQRRQLGVSARRVFEEQFSVESMIQRYDTLYKRCLDISTA